MLPLVGDECATIWTADHATIAQLMTLSEKDFLFTLQKEFGYRLGKLIHVSQRYTFPLRMVRAEKNVEQCVFLIGNSAHTLHPIAAQGFNLALYEVAALVAKIEEILIEQKSFHCLNWPKINANATHQQNLSMRVSHRLANLFNSHSSIIHSILQLGMIGFDLLTPVKKKFIKKMLGQHGTVPTLLLRIDDL